VEETKVSAIQKFQLYKQDGAWKTSCDLRGLALGGWFVPEKFINIAGWATPDMPHTQSKPMAEGTIYEGSETVPDLCSLSRKLGREELDLRMKRHLESFIKEDDFKYIAKTGVNTLRIPIGYWNVIEDPYEMYAPIQPNVSLGYLDNAMKWAAKYDLAVVLDLHASPGSQNGWEHSGCSGNAGLFKGGEAKKNQKLSVDTVEKLAERYANHPALLGIEVINEPVGYNPHSLVQLYKDSYDAIRKHDKDVWVIGYAHNADRVAGLKQYELTNFVLDKHNYACFGDGRSGPPGQTYQHHAQVVESWKKDLTKMSSSFPTILGEWSLCHGGGSALKLKDWNKIQQDAWKESTVGAVFWTYKTLTDNARWSYRVSLDSVDVMGDLPRCKNEDAAPQKLTAKFLRVSEKEIDVGYEWEADLEKVEAKTV
jgi:glucan 1,3-beta-glucosidase